MQEKYHNLKNMIESDESITGYSVVGHGLGSDNLESKSAFSDFLNWSQTDNPEFDTEYLNFADYGYHFRLPGGTLAFVGRSYWEQDMLRRSARNNDIILQPCGFDNPMVLCRNIAWNNDILLAAGILASFTVNGATEVEIAAADGSGPTRTLQGIMPLDVNLLEKLKIQSIINKRTKEISV